MQEVVTDAMYELWLDQREAGLADGLLRRLGPYRDAFPFRGDPTRTPGKSE